MLTVYKFIVPLQDYFTLDLPENARILTVQTQNEEPYIWAMLESNNDKEKRNFRLVGTGNSLYLNPDKIIKYVGTFQLGNGALVFHLFEIK